MKWFEGVFQSNRVFSFALIGALVAVLYVGLYLTFLRFGLGSGTANGLAFSLAVIMQYVAQARFTFRRQLSDARQMLQFGLMVAGGAVTSALITGGVAPYFMLPPWTAALIVTLILPLQNFVCMSLWVFPKSREQEA